jgi:hypothetical protein
VSPKDREALTAAVVAMLKRARAVRFKRAA